MLTTAEIIELYDNNQYDIICDKLQIESQENSGTDILLYAINTCNPVLITHTFKTENITGKSISHIMYNPSIYDIFQSIIENNLELCNKIRHILEPYFVSFYNTLCEKDNTQFLKIIIAYLPSDKIILNIVDSVITHNHLNILDILIAYGYDINLFFSEIIDNVQHGVRFELSTIVSLEHYITINNYINELIIMFFMANNVDGLKYCLDNGADINCVWNKFNDDIEIKTISYLLDLGADINLIVYWNILQIMGFNDIGSDIVIFLISRGLDIRNYINEMATDSIYFESP